MLAFDTEANGLDQYAPGFRVFMVTWADATGEWMCDENTGYQPFLDAIRDEPVLVAANASYDIHALREAGIIDLLSSGHRVHDVLTLARVLLPGRWQYKLKGLADDILGAGSSDEEAELKALAKKHKISWTLKDKDYYGLWLAEPEAMALYAKQDVRITYDLFAKLWAGASHTDATVYDMEIRQVAPILRAAEARGVLVDEGRLAGLKLHLEGRRDDLRLLLLAQGFTEEALGAEATDDEEKISASSKALLADLLRIGVPLYRKTPKSGQVNPKTGKRAPDQLAVNKDALAEFKARFPAVSDLIAWRSCNQILRTFVVAMEKANPRVHTSFRQLEARTSRMSSANPNMQNLPRPGEDNDGDPEAQALALGVRAVIVPEPGNALLVADFDSIEMRVLAFRGGDEGFIKLLDDGLDPHQATAAKVYGGAYEDYVKGGASDKKRTDAKTTTFRTVYGGGANLTSVQLGIPVIDAAALIAGIKDAIPGYNELNERIRRTLRSRGEKPYVTTILGRRLSVPKHKPYVGLNTVIQGDAAELMKLALIAAAPVLATFGYRIILVVHDELVAEGPACNADAALLALVDAMESVYPLRPALKVSGSHSTISYAAAK